MCATYEALIIKYTALALSAVIPAFKTMFWTMVDMLEAQAAGFGCLL